MLVMRLGGMLDVPGIVMTTRLPEWDRATKNMT